MTLTNIVEIQELWPGQTEMLCLVWSAAIGAPCSLFMMCIWQFADVNDDFAWDFVLLRKIVVVAILWIGYCDGAIIIANAIGCVILIKRIPLKTDPLLLGVKGTMVLALCGQVVVCESSIPDLRWLAWFEMFWMSSDYHMLSSVNRPALI